MNLQSKLLSGEGKLSVGTEEMLEGGNVEIELVEE